MIYILSARNFHNCNYFNHHKSDWSELKWSLENAQPVNLSLCVCDKFLALICYLGREIGPFPISHRFRPGPRIICQTSPPITKIKFGHPNLWMQNYLSLIHWNSKYLYPRVLNECTDRLLDNKKWYKYYNFFHLIHQKLHRYFIYFQLYIYL